MPCVVRQGTISLSAGTIVSRSGADLQIKTPHRVWRLTASDGPAAEEQSARWENAIAAAIVALPSSPRLEESDVGTPLSNDIAPGLCGGSASDAAVQIAGEKPMLFWDIPDVVEWAASQPVIGSSVVAELRAKRVDGATLVHLSRDVCRRCLELSEGATDSLLAAILAWSPRTPGSAAIARGRPSDPGPRLMYCITVKTSKHLLAGTTASVSVELVASGGSRTFALNRSSV